MDFIEGEGAIQYAKKKDADAQRTKKKGPDDYPLGKLRSKDHGPLLLQHNLRSAFI